MKNVLSIITINYNNLEGLKKTVQSILNQTWQEFEYIIIDGGSTDGSAAFIESKNDQIDYWISEKDSGIYNAMNKGIKKASGEYLLFLNSGDHLFDNIVLEKYNKLLVKKDLIFFNLNFVKDKSSWINKYPEFLNFSFFIVDTLPHPSTFIKKDLFKTTDYDENFKIISDWKFFMESICQDNCSYIWIDETLTTFYTDGLSSEPQNKKIIFKERHLVLKPKLLIYLENLTDPETRNEVVYLYLKTLKKSLTTKNYNIFFKEVLSFKPIAFRLRIKLISSGIAYVLFKKGLDRFSNDLRVLK
ncbi:glycosyltransferase family 2 protein [Flavobacterium sp. MMLR14_040]|uniref:glycosyltransferase family 2 protein n=1 Tax=Flavobacterium sp. MMLR14_040 TaxID=3093843 RepID=UPI00298F9D1C|nr:glycosyltransferase family 2 protein [Flavobacterium sp. MMLR14_040]MDW8849245.1 glycosyltransferase family 2 protein [Flavobacterium sp. MMLR14_040]